MNRAKTTKTMTPAQFEKMIADSERSIVVGDEEIGSVILNNTPSAALYVITLFALDGAELNRMVRALGATIAEPQRKRTRKTAQSARERA